MMPYYVPLIIAAFAILVVSACLFYMQIARDVPPKQVVLGSIAGTIVGVLALGFALAH